MKKRIVLITIMLVIFCGCSVITAFAQDPFSSEALDPYNVRTFWDTTKSVDTYCQVMGLHYNSAETERLLKQVDFDFKAYSGPFDIPLPGIDRAECYAWAAPDGNVFRFDYKHYVEEDMSPAQIAGLYFTVVEAFADIAEKSPDTQSYFVDDRDYDSFDYEAMVDQLTKGGDRYSFRTFFGMKTNDSDCQEVMLLKRDGTLSLFLRWYLPLEAEAPQAKQTSAPQTSGNNGSQSGGSPSRGKVIFSSFYTHDELPPGEGILEAAGFSATPNGSGGYDCSVTIANVSYAMESSIYCMLYARGGDDAYDITLAESDYFDKGAAKTYYFTVPADMVASGDCEVMVEYTFW